MAGTSSIALRLASMVLVLAVSLAAAQPVKKPNGQKPPAPGKTAATARKPPAEAVELVRGLYPVTAASDYPFSARLRKFYAAARANSERINAPVAGLDFAFQVNAQDTEPGYEKTLKIAPRRSDGTRAAVRVSLRNYRPVELLFLLVRENGHWAIDEVRSLREPRWILSRLYAAGAKEK